MRKVLSARSSMSAQASDQHQELLRAARQRPVEAVERQLSGWESAGGPAPCVPRRAHSSPRHACALHRVLFLHHLHKGQEQAQQGYG